jgi:hypothetical protein
MSGQVLVLLDPTQLKLGSHSNPRIFMHDSDFMDESLK